MYYEYTVEKQYQKIQQKIQIRFFILLSISFFGLISISIHFMRFEIFPLYIEYIVENIT